MYGTFFVRSSFWLNESLQSGVFIYLWRQKGIPLILSDCINLFVYIVCRSFFSILRNVFINFATQYELLNAVCFCLKCFHYVGFTMSWRWCIVFEQRKSTFGRCVLRKIVFEQVRWICVVCATWGNWFTFRHLLFWTRRPMFNLAQSFIYFMFLFRENVSIFWLPTNAYEWCSWLNIYYKVKLWENGENFSHK